MKRVFILSNEMYDAYFNACGCKKKFFMLMPNFHFQGIVLDSLLFRKHSKRS